MNPNKIPKELLEDLTKKRVEEFIKFGCECTLAIMDAAGITVNRDELEALINEDSDLNIRLQKLCEEADENISRKMAEKVTQYIFETTIIPPKTSSYNN